MWRRQLKACKASAIFEGATLPSSPSDQYVFLSYRSLERGFALKLAADLKNAGLSLWMDVFDITPGHMWDAAITAAVDRCAAALILVSPGYLESDICRNELERIRSLGKPIIPLLCETLVRTEDWPLVIQRTQYLDFTGWREPQRYEQHVAALLSMLQDRAAGSLSQPPDVETRYLNSLVRELQSARGVLEYVEMEAIDNGVPIVAPDEWGFDLLLDVGSSDHQNRRFRGIDELVRATPQLVLLGEAGMGKTTTLRRIALNAAKTRIVSGSSAPMPLMIALKEWPPGTAFSDFLASRWRFSSPLENAVSAGAVLLLLDGLNEITAADEPRVKQVRRYLGSLPSQARAIVSCRTHDYAAFHLDAPFAAAELADLTDTQIRKLASRYLGPRAPEFIAAALPRDDRTRTDVSLAISDLARNTYLVSAFVFLYQQSPDKQLPANTGVLFSKLAQALWAREERRNSSGVSHSDRWPTAKGRLAQLALNCTEQNAADVSEPDVEAILGDQELWRLSVASGILVRAGGYVSYAHDLMKSYFCAEALLSADVDQLSDWCRQHQRDWETVIVAWSGLSPLSDQFLATRHWQDGAQILSRGYATTPNAIQDVVRQAISAFDLTDSRELQPVVDSLVLLGRHSVPALIDRCRSSIDDVRERAAFVLGYVDDPRAVDSLLLLVDDPAKAVRSRAETALLQIGLGDQRRALSGARHGSPSVRRAAASTLRQIAPADSADALSTLASDADPFVRAEALIGLASIGDDGVIAPLLTAVESSDEWIRKMAIQGLSLSTDVRAKSAIVAGLNDKSANVRIASAEALSEVHDSAALATLITHTVDPDHRVRAAVVRALGATGDERAMVALHDTLGDREPGVSAAAATALRQLGWLPSTREDRIRLAVARERWSDCLDEGPEAISALRQCLVEVDDRRGVSIVDLLRKLKWQPTELGPDLFRFCALATDWEMEAKQFADYRRHRFHQSTPHVTEWLDSSRVLRTPLFRIVTEAIRGCHTLSCGSALMSALVDGDARIQLVAATIAEIGQCSDVATELLACLADRPWSELVMVVYQLRIAAARALGGIGDQSTAGPLLAHVCARVRNGDGETGDSSALAAIQAFARITNARSMFKELPSTTIGDASSQLIAELLRYLKGYELEESVVDILNTAPLASRALIDWATQHLPERFVSDDLWRALDAARNRTRELFWLEESESDSADEGFEHVADVIEAMANSERPLRTLSAWSLHRRIAVLTLVQAVSDGAKWSDLARDALTCFSDDSSFPVLIALRRWPPLREVAKIELIRRCRLSRAIS